MKYLTSALVLSLLLSACSQGSASVLSISDQNLTPDSELVLLGDEATYDFHYNSNLLNILGDPTDSTVRFQLPGGGTVNLSTVTLAQSGVENHLTTLERWGDQEVYRYSEALAQPGCRREYADTIVGDEVLMAELTLCSLDNERDAMKALTSLFTQLVITGEDKGPYSL